MELSGCDPSRSSYTNSPGRAPGLLGPFSTMKNIFNQIWQAALPFQDKRDDAGHAAVTYYYAQQLVQLKRADADVILPAIILHDTGWSQLTRQERFVIFDANATKEDELHVRHRHQEEGVRIARKILQNLAYPRDLIIEILEIISQHDTRQGFISESEGLVRDADKLWRFSRTGFDADIVRFEFEPQFLIDRLLGQIPEDNFFYSSLAKDIARSELDLRSKEYVRPANSPHADAALVA